LKAWWRAYVLCALVFAAFVTRHPITRGALLGALAYFAECVVQQLIFQHLICAPLAEDPATTRKSQWIAALLFAVVHLPNPVLVPATFAWGFAACGLFRRRRSLWAVAIFQYLLSGILYASVPYAWHHAFRIGPRYLMAGLLPPPL
jgi:membrane protease YdiL (CAAX protease family)